MPAASRAAAAAAVKQWEPLAGHPLQRSRRAARLDPPPPQADAACAEGGGWDVEPPPTEAERASCEIDQRTELSEAEWCRDY